MVVGVSKGLGAEHQGDEVDEISPSREADIRGFQIEGFWCSAPTPSSLICEDQMRNK